MVNTSQQVGGAVGLALLSTVSASAAADYARTHLGLPGLAGAAAVHGYTTGFWWAAGIFATGLVLALVILPWKAEASRVHAQDGVRSWHCLRTPPRGCGRGRRRPRSAR